MLHARQSPEAAPAPAPAGDNTALAGLIAGRLVADASRLAAQFAVRDGGRVRCCWIDDLLPPGILAAATASLPPLSAMLRRSDDKERKYVCADLGGLSPPLRDMIGAFTRRPVVEAVAGMMGKDRLESDELLYNGGLTVMMPGDFMRPHLDNSHDYERRRRREVVLLFYISPEWQSAYGGDLKLWPLDSRAEPEIVAFRPNRLVIMETTGQSWHSLEPILGPAPRINLTTYFYAPASERAPLRLTRFTGWPGETMRSLWFGTQFHMRNAAARIAGRRLVGNRHINHPDPGTTTAGQKGADGAALSAESGRPAR